MDIKKLRLLLIGIIAIEIMVFAADVSIGLNKLSIKSQRLVDAKLKSQTVDAQLSSLGQAKKQVEKYGYFNNVAKTVLPNDKDQAQAVVDIFNLADQSGISIASVTFPASTLGGSRSATGAGSSSAAISQAKPVSGIKGLYSLELTIIPQTGSTVPANKISTFPKFLDFLTKIENNRRTAQISQVSIQPQKTNSEELGFSLSINIFIRPAK